MNLTPLLKRAKDAGLSLRAEDDYIVAAPKENVTAELRVELRRRKPELLEVLRWDDDAARVLGRYALHHLAEFYLDAKEPDFDIEVLHEPDAAVEAAWLDQDMFRLRLAVRSWVESGRAAFESLEKSRDRGAA